MKLVKTQRSGELFVKSKHHTDILLSLCECLPVVCVFSL